MNRQEVKQLLVAYRPEDREPAEPQAAEALRQAQSDRDLLQWLERQTAFHHRMEEAVAGIEVPAGLKERILNSAQAESKVVRFPRRAFLPLGLAAGFAAAAGLTLWFRSVGNDFDAYRDRMARLALRDYRMSMVSRSQADIRRYVQEHSLHGDFVLTPRMAQLPGEGCAFLSWQGRPVTLICLDAGNRVDLFLFVVERKDVDNPPPGQPEFRQVSKLATYSWSVGDKVYLLAAKDEPSSLARFL